MSATSPQRVSLNGCGEAGCQVVEPDRARFQGEGMIPRAWWLQPGPASRCLTATFVWLALSGLSITVLFMSWGGSWWTQLIQVATILSWWTLVAVYFASYRVHKREETESDR